MEYKTQFRWILIISWIIICILLFANAIDLILSQLDSLNSYYSFSDSHDPFLDFQLFNLVIISIFNFLIISLSIIAILMSYLNKKWIWIVGSIVSFYIFITSIRQSLYYLALNFYNDYIEFDYVIYLRWSSYIILSVLSIVVLFFYVKYYLQDYIKTINLNEGKLKNRPYGP